MDQINLLDFEGSYYEMGLACGRVANNSIQFQNMIAGVKESMRTGKSSNETKRMLNYFCPSLLEELEGLGESLSYSEQEVLGIFGGYDMPVLQMGCTSFVTRDFYVRNYDFSPSVYDGCFVIQRHMKDEWTCGNSELMVGRLDGMNHSGLTCGLHFVNNELHEKGFIASTIVRIVLEMCKTVNEAIDLLDEIPHSASYNYSLIDRHGDFAIFEATHEKRNIFRESESLSCVNMFQTDKMKSYNRLNVDSSFDRLKAMSCISSPEKSVEEVHNWFSDKSSPVFYEDCENFFGTLHTVSYVPNENRVMLTTPEMSLQEIRLNK